METSRYFPLCILLGLFSVFTFPSTLFFHPYSHFSSLIISFLNYFSLFPFPFFSLFLWDYLFLLTFLLFFHHVSPINVFYWLQLPLCSLCCSQDLCGICWSPWALTPTSEGRIRPGEKFLQFKETRWQVLGEECWNSNLNFHPECPSGLDNQAAPGRWAITALPCARDQWAEHPAGASEGSNLPDVHESKWKRENGKWHLIPKWVKLSLYPEKQLTADTGLGIEGISAGAKSPLGSIKACCKLQGHLCMSSVKLGITWACWHPAGLGFIALEIPQGALTHQELWALQGLMDILKHFGVTVWRVAGKTWASKTL